VDAVQKVSQRHPHLRSRIATDESGAAMLTEEGSGSASVQSVPRQSADHWIRVVEESCRIPFDFSARPPVRFVMLESARATDIVILCHRIICDGLSLAYVARDLLAHLANSALAVEPLAEAAPMNRDNLPSASKASALARMAIGRMNRRWERERVVFSQEDYRSLHRAYWARYTHRVLPVELDEAETAALVDRCRAHEVTVNSALAAAFTGAQQAVLGEKEFPDRVAVAVDLRERLPRPPGEAMGFYQGTARPRYRYTVDKGFWENARRLQAALQPLLTDKALFLEPLVWTQRAVTLLEAIPFKRLGGLVPSGAPRHARLAGFARRNDTLTVMQKREGGASLDQRRYGTAITDLGRLDLARQYGTLTLERVIYLAGAEVPLVTVNLALGAAIVAERLSLAIEFVEDNVDMATMENICDRALEILRE
jgi:hypothetical protein